MGIEEGPSGARLVSMTQRPNYYRVLHVQPDAPMALIKASYRTLLQDLKMHPDLGGLHDQAVLINEAFATLGDPEKRAVYDRELDQAARAAATARTNRRREEAPALQRHPASPPRGPAPTSNQRTDTTRRCGFCNAPAAAAHTDTPDGACHACGSALFPARRYETGEETGRALSRLPRRMPMTFRRSTALAETKSGMTQDVSLNGARFATHSFVRVGERLSLECEFCSAVAVVKSVRGITRHGDRGWQVGVEFVTLRIKHARGGLVSATV